MNSTTGQGCALCSLIDAIDTRHGWYGSDAPLCASCRRIVVIRHDQRRPGTPMPGRQYSHLKAGSFPLSAQPWPYPDCETRVVPDTFRYYRSVRSFIGQEALSAPETRKGYIDASMDLIARYGPLRTSKNGDTADKPDKPDKPARTAKPPKPTKPDYRQQMLFADFPPK